MPAALPWTTDSVSLGSAQSGLLPFACITSGTSGGTVQANFNGFLYKWTSPGTGSVVIGTCGLTTADTVVAVYSASPADAGGLTSSARCVAARDEGCGTSAANVGRSRYTLSAEAGLTYFIFVGTYNNVASTATVQVSATGTLTLCAGHAAGGGRMQRPARVPCPPRQATPRPPPPLPPSIVCSPSPPPAAPPPPASPPPPPAPGWAGFVSVFGDSAFASLSCTNGGVIDGLLDPVYGCFLNANGLFSNSTKAWSYPASQCLGKQACSVSAHWENYQPDPCPGQGKRARQGAGAGCMLRQTV